MNTNYDKPYKKIDLGYFFQIALTCGLIIIFIYQWNKMISTPQDRISTDFMAFFAAGRISQTIGFHAIYNIDLQHNIEQDVAGFDLEKEQVLLYNHMPYLAPLLKVIVNTNYMASFARWVILMLAIYIIGGILFINSLFSTLKDELYFGFVIGLLTFFPFFVSLQLGQDTAILFLGMSLWCIGIIKKQDWLIASGLALTTVRPHICLTLAVPLIFRNRKAWWRFLIIASFLALVSILMLGKEGTLEFINLLQISAAGIWHGMNEAAMLNIIGLLLRLLPFINQNVVHTVGWIGYGIGIGIVSLLWIKTKEIDGRLLGISILIALLCSPHLHYHDLTLLIIPLFFSIYLATPSISSKFLRQLPLGASLLLMITSLHFIIPYVLYLVLGWQLTRRHNL